MVRVLSALVALALGGCTTTPTILSWPLTEARPGSGQIVVKRDTDSAGSACTHRIYLDGTPAAELQPGQWVTLYAGPGEHLLTALVSAASCRGSFREAMLVLRIDQRQVFRTGLDRNGGIKIEPMGSSAGDQ